MDPVTKLLAIEEIKQLKAQYFQRLDSKEWTELAALFTPDAVIDYSRHAIDLIDNHGRTDIEPPPPEWIFVGGSAAVGFLSPLLAEVISVHHGHDPQVEITGVESATGFWSLYDRLEFADEVYHGYGHYEEEYRVVNGRWRISRLVLTRQRSAFTAKSPAR